MTGTPRAASAALDRAPDARVVIGPLELYPPGLSLRLAGRRVLVAPREYQVLLLLAQQVDRVVTTRSLLDEVWGEGFVDAHGNLKAQVARVRRCLREHLAVDPVRTVRGLGYVLDSDVLTGRGT